MESPKISTTQFTFIVILFIIGSSILIVPAGISQEAKQNGWIAGIVGLAGGLAGIFLFNVLRRQLPSSTLLEVCEAILGKWLGRSVSFAYIAFFFMLAATVMWDLVNFLTTHILISTPIEVISILFMSLIIFATRLGIETIVRCGEVFFPWVIVLFLILILFALPDARISNILPIWEGGVKPIWKGALFSMTIPYLQLIVFLMLYPYVTQSKKNGKEFFIGTLLGGVILIIITLTCLLVLGVEGTTIQSHPSYALGKKINFGNFIQRIEAIVAIIWMLTIFFKLVILFYSSTLGFAQLLGVKDYRTLTLPLGMLMVVLSLVIFPSGAYANEFATTEWIPYCFTMCVFLPLLLLIIGKFRK